MAESVNDWRTSKYSFFSHRECECFPCHEWREGEDFNCLFCYCPLYFLGTRCGGNFKITESGIKDCSGCGIPHHRESYGYIIEKFTDAAREAAKSNGET